MQLDSAPTEIGESALGEGSQPGSPAVSHSCAFVVLGRSYIHWPYGPSLCLNSGKGADRMGIRVRCAPWNVLGV